MGLKKKKKKLHRNVKIKKLLTISNISIFHAETRPRARDVLRRREFRIPLTRQHNDIPFARGYARGTYRDIFARKTGERSPDSRDTTRWDIESLPPPPSTPSFVQTRNLSQFKI